MSKHNSNKKKRREHQYNKRTRFAIFCALIMLLGIAIGTSTNPNFTGLNILLPIIFFIIFIIALKELFRIK